jgi:phage terminase large subunit-like protein
MGLRGPGAARRLAAVGTKALRKSSFPWAKVGLSRSARVIAFLEFLPITKGPLTGQKMKLLPGQVRFVERVYGDLKPDGRRRKRLAVKSEPKGNGKTGLVAGLCLCHLIGPEAEPRGEVYSAAMDREQAGIMFREMEAIIFAVPDFAAIVNIQRWHKRIEVMAGQGEGSIYEALSADARRAHGLAPSLFAYDELAQAKNRTLLDNLINGLGKRNEALGIVISTQAPDDDHPLSQMIDDGLSGADDSIYVDLAAAPAEANPFDEKTWFACNEALGIFLSLDEMREAAERARRIPGFEASFRNLRLNQRIDASEEQRIVPAAIWKLGAVPVDRKRLKGRMCFGGLDLSGKDDLTALVLVFPDDEAEPGYDILPFFWTPLGALESRRPAERDLFKLWIQQKHLIGIPGPIIRYSFVVQQLKMLSDIYDIQLIGYDRWRIKDFNVELADVGLEKLPMKDFGQGFQSMAPAIDHFAELALTGKLRHGGHPVLTACVSNAIVISDPAGNRKFDKERASVRGTIRIDGAVALAQALAVAKGEKPEKPMDIDGFLANVVAA